VLFGIFDRTAHGFLDLTLAHLLALLAPSIGLKKLISAFLHSEEVISTMPFLAKEYHPVPTKDLLSWTFDDLAYDWDDPVSSSPNPPIAQAPKENQNYQRSSTLT
jgi:hypothetical protein